MNVGSLFAGIGGFDLAARWAGWRTTWYSEIDPYACAVMRRHFPGAINLGDIRHIVDPPAVDVLCGGFPCQDISLAGKGAGIDGERSGLWAEYARIIGEIRPQWIIIENVSALRSRGLDRVLGQLDALGYDAEWHCIHAAYVGAPHRRDRIWIVAYPAGEGWRSETGGTERGDGSAAVCARPPVLGRCGGDVADTERMRQLQPQGSVADERRWAGDSGWWGTEPDVGRVASRVPARVDRLRCLGNSIVPQVASLIFAAINAHERVTR